jgi:hypothetical protein
LDEASRFCEPRIIEILKLRDCIDKKEGNGELQCLCVLGQSKTVGGGGRGTGKPFWLNYRDLLLNPDHAASLEKYEASLRPEKKKRSDEETHEKRSRRTTA